MGFTVACAGWQNFYILVGTAAATLIGLMFVAITFGASMVKVENSESTRAFLDPTLTHFVQVLVTACLMVIPSMGSMTLGGLLLVIGVFRGTALARVFRHMRAAAAKNSDIELSDWMSGIVVPLLAHALVVASGVGFLMGRFAFGFLAIATLAVLLNGIYSAWELVVWIALTRSRTP
jgi:hypothetical protein